MSITTREVDTHRGRVRGRTDGVADQFLGLRYAAPVERGLPPRALRPWQGTYDATRMGQQAHQRRGIRTPAGRRAADCLGPFPDAPMGEDCLFLNLYRPAAPAPGPRPVMVWVHGGGFWEGSPHIYDGRRLAAAADAVVVIIGYRVGYLGVGDFRQVGGEYGRSVNLWHQDQVAALDWVHDTIADFGGDPGNVTVLGQSAGATSILALAASPATRGRMHRAVALSPAFVAAEDDQHGRLAAALGIEAGDVPRWLLDATPEDLLAVAAAGVVPMPFVDGDVIEADPHVAIAGQGEAVPLLSGFTPHEGHYLSLCLQFDGLPPEVVGLVAHGVAALSAGRPALTADYIARLNDVAPTEDPLAFADVVWTDLIRSSSVLAAEATARAGAAAWHYRFDVPAELLGHQMGSTHGVDVPFTFGMVDDPERRPFLWVAADEANTDLARRWMQMLGTFARTGQPGDGLGAWPPYEPGDRSTLHVAPHGSELLHDVDAAHRTKVWARHLD